MTYLGIRQQTVDQACSVIADLSVRLLMHASLCSLIKPSPEAASWAKMGSPVSAVVANLYIEFFEELALRTSPTRPRIWKRYVNDSV